MCTRNSRYCIVFCNRHQICISKLSPFALGAVHKRCHQSVGKGASKLYRFAVIIIRCHAQFVRDFWQFLPKFRQINIINRIEKFLFQDSYLKSVRL